MAAHGLRPIAERNGSSLALPMKVEPLENGFGCFPRRPEIASDIGKAMIVSKHHIAVSKTRPQAGLALDFHIAPPCGPQQILHFGNEHFSPASPIGARLFMAAEAAGGANDDCAHKGRHEIAIDGSGSAMGKIGLSVNH
jgi:hypothetical protein